MLGGKILEGKVSRGIPKGKVSNVVWIRGGETVTKPKKTVKKKRGLRGKKEKGGAKVLIERRRAGKT